MHFPCLPKMWTSLFFRFVFFLCAAISRSEEDRDLLTYLGLSDSNKLSNGFRSSAEHFIRLDGDQACLISTVWTLSTSSICSVTKQCLDRAQVCLEVVFFSLMASIFKQRCRK